MMTSRPDDAPAPVAGFERIIHAARVPATNSRGAPVWARLWVEVRWKGGRLSLVGSVGQCGIHAEARPAKGWTHESLSKLRDIWNRWHLNDMRPYNDAMRAAGWHLEAKRPVVGYDFTRTRESQEAFKAAERAARAAAEEGRTFTPTPAQDKALNSPHTVTLWTFEGEPEPEPPEGRERSRYPGPRGGVKVPERKTLRWIRPSEFAPGLLGRKLNPDDSHGYGNKWWPEPVPADVLQWLSDMPEPPGGLRPPWV